MKDALPQPKSRHPDLYVGGADDTVDLLAMRCDGCGHVAFPRQPYGCEKCGATGASLVDVVMPACGRLASFATVHVHQAKNIAAPFVIGEITLDAGPTLRTTMVESTDAGLAIGARVEGRLVPAPGEAPPGECELRFVQVAQ